MCAAGRSRCADGGADLRVGRLLTAGRDRKNLIGKFTGGFSAVYNLTGYLSDVLSYSRLFGMGLATGVIGMVFNTIAFALRLRLDRLAVCPGSSVVAGHGFNMAVNTLGALCACLPAAGHRVLRQVL